MQREIQVATDHVVLDGDLAVPDRARGVVLFAHGSGSSRHSPRNQYVAQALQQAGLATLLLDLLSQDEEAVDMQTRQLRFDVGMLAERLVAAVEWLGHKPETSLLPVGCFGASTGAAAALIAATERPGTIAAVVSRGGRPDLAGEALGSVFAPTLLIVGGNDLEVLELNRQALDRIPSTDKRLEVIPGATHLFEEPGALEEVARLAREWFVQHLPPRP